MVDPKGWHSRGDLPHFDSPEIVQFVTFRLADSLPKAVSEALHREAEVHRIERDLDVGFGACWLGRAEIASIVEAALMHFDAQRYRLLAWCLMPNHVHVVIELANGHALGNIVRSWKSFTALQSNTRLGRTGRFWHADYFDRFMRNEEHHLAQTIDYVEQNPVKVVTVARNWAWSSARFRKL